MEGQTFLALRQMQHLEVTIIVYICKLDAKQGLIPPGRQMKSHKQEQFQSLLVVTITESRLSNGPTKIAIDSLKRWVMES